MVAGSRGFAVVASEGKALAEQTAKATGEISQQISGNITDVQHGASETGSASAQVHSAAKLLSGDSNRLKLDQLPAGTAGAVAVRLRNRIRWYSQPIATSTSPRHMNDSAR